MLLWALEEMMADWTCVIAGSATRVADALAFVSANTFDVAILDASLQDGSIEPVVAVLTARGCPFVIASGTNPSERNSHFFGPHAVQKPYTELALRTAIEQAVFPARPASAISVIPFA